MMAQEHSRVSSSYRSGGVVPAGSRPERHPRHNKGSVSLVGAGKGTIT